MILILTSYTNQMSKPTLNHVTLFAILLHSNKENHIYAPQIMI